MEESGKSNGFSRNNGEFMNKNVINPWTQHNDIFIEFWWSWLVGWMTGGYYLTAPWLDSLKIAVSSYLKQNSVEYLIY